MITGADWYRDGFEDGTHKIVGEVQLRAYGKFLEEYRSHLLGIQDALEDLLGDSCDINVDPITMEFVPHEECAMLKLIDTDNKVLNKVLAVFAALCTEVQALQTEGRTKFYGTLMFYAEGEHPCILDGATQMMMASLLPCLQELAGFIKRCEEVTVNIVQQLSAVYLVPQESSQVMDAVDIHFQDVFDHLGDLLLIFITLDEILSNHGTLQDHWIVYKRTVLSAYHNPGKFGVLHEKLITFEEVLNDLEIQLLSGKIFQNAVEQPFNSKKMQVTKNTALVDEFFFYLKSSINDLEARANDKLNSNYLLMWVKLCALYVLNYQLFGAADKKLFKQLWELHKKVPVVTLIGNVLWVPENFLLTHLPLFAKTVDKRSQQAIMSSRLHYLQQKSVNLTRDTQIFSLQTFSWMTQMEKSFTQESTQLKLEDLIHRCKLLLQGVYIASAISHLLKTVTNLHVTLAKPMTKTAVVAVCKMVELLKGIEHVYHRHFMPVAESVNHVIQHLSYRTLSIIAAAKKGLIQDQRYSKKHLDILSSLVLIEKALHGPGTKERNLVLRLALCTANQMKTFREDEFAQLSALLQKLSVICDIQEKITEACDCSFLYWHRVVLPNYFAHVFESKTDVHNLLYMFSALQDCVDVMERDKKDTSRSLLKNSFEKEVWKYLHDHVIQPLCHEIETNLRLHVHSHLQLDDRNPFRMKIENNSQLLCLRPLRFFDKYIHIKGYVERYLEETFYNLTTVALHDWKTYGEMRSLANHKFGLQTVEDHLPSQTLEQGLDVLEIMRNIHIFVAKYLYNLNNQIFVEQSSNNKHLNTINIRHVANSIRTHGTGIMNTTVNFTYQFLRKKFFTFSQFMYDEHIKSRLIKDLRFFRENKAQLEQKYSYERAYKFNKGIRKLGVTADGQSFMDQFRILVSHIGNAMGYVRMIRSGGLHCCSNAICFIPDLEDIVCFKDLCTEERLSVSCQGAAQKLDQIVSNLTRNFAEGTDYFRLLSDVFAPVFRDPKNIHLRNFYMIVPPLTINFVEHSITCKEKMSKKNKVDAAFTDDGFAMGIAYILRLIDQYGEFDSLHWFQSVRDKYNKDKQSLLKQNSFSSRDDEKLQQTMTLTARRLDMYLQEFQLLHYSLSSARIFFQKDKVVGES